MHASYAQSRYGLSNFSTSMKLPIPCYECSAGKPESEYQIMKVEIRDDGRYEVECPNGHVNVTFLEQLKFEVLFEIGVHGIIDGYYREAISSFSSSLEKFYEFAIKSILIENNIESHIIKESWKSVSSQSERQLGAFIFLYTHEFARSPSLLSNSNIAFRNKVIHKGKIPLRSEAIRFGQAVFNIINPTLLQIKTNYPDGVELVKQNHLDQIMDENAKDYSVQWISTMVNILKCGKRHEKISLDKYVKQLEVRE